MASVQKYVFTAITYHESVPGHHFQIALAQEIEGLPKLRRFAGYGAYVEGWALYAEQLAREMGFYRDPLHDFGRLQNELWRAVRLVVDTGIHAERWSRAQAIDYFRANTPLSEGNIVTEVERYFVNPGQALSYKMGMIEILDLRRRAREALGEAFDIRDFHRVVLGAGALPLPLLRQRVEGWIAERSTAGLGGAATRRARGPARTCASTAVTSPVTALRSPSRPQVLSHWPRISPNPSSVASSRSPRPSSPVSKAERTACPRSSRVGPASTSTATTDRA